MKILINESAFLKLLEAEKRRVKVKSEREVKWHRDFYQFLKSTEIPLSTKIDALLYGEQEVNTFHITAPDKLDGFLKILNKENAISSFQFMSKNLLRDLHGVQNKGGLLFYLSGILVFSSPNDAMTRPDDFGRRWIGLEKFPDKIQSDIKEMREKSNVEITNKDGTKTIINKYRQPEKIAKTYGDVLKLVAEYQKNCLEILKKYSYSMHYHMFEEKGYYGDSWSEQVIRNFKINEALIGLYKISGFENYKLVQNKPIEARTIEDNRRIENFEKDVNVLVNKIKEYASCEIFLCENSYDVIKFVEERGGFSDGTQYKEEQLSKFDELNDDEKQKIIENKINTGKILTTKQFEYLNDEQTLRYLEKGGILTNSQFKTLKSNFKEIYIKNRGWINMKINWLDKSETNLINLYVDMFITNKSFFNDELEIKYLDGDIYLKYIKYLITNKRRLGIDDLRKLSDELKLSYIQNYDSTLTSEELGIFSSEQLEIYFDKLISKKTSITPLIFLKLNEKQKVDYINNGFELNDEMFDSLSESYKKYYVEKIIEKIKPGLRIRLSEKQLIYLSDENIIKYVLNGGYVSESLFIKLNDETKIELLKKHMNGYNDVYDYQIEFIIKNEELIAQYIEKYSTSYSFKKSIFEKLDKKYQINFIIAKINNNTSGRLVITYDEFIICDNDLKIRFINTLKNGIFVPDDWLSDVNEDIIRTNITKKISYDYQLNDKEYKLLTDDEKRTYCKRLYRLSPEQITLTPENILIEYSENYHNQLIRYKSVYRGLPSRFAQGIIVDLVKYLSDDTIHNLIINDYITEANIDLVPKEKEKFIHIQSVKSGRQVPIDILMKFSEKEQISYFSRLDSSFYPEDSELLKLSKPVFLSLINNKIDRRKDISDEIFSKLDTKTRDRYILKFADIITPEKINQLTASEKFKLSLKRRTKDIKLTKDEFDDLASTDKLLYLKYTNTDDTDFDRLTDTQKLAFVLQKLTKGQDITQKQFDWIPKDKLKISLSVGIPTTPNVFNFMDDSEKSFLIKTKLNRKIMLQSHEMKWYNENKDKVSLSENMNEEIFYYKDLSPTEKNKIYDMFKDSYIKATGKSWDKNKFEFKSSLWTFYGLKDRGFIAARKQSGGMHKLTGSAGDLSGINVGVKDLIALNEPIWGVAPEKIRSILVKKYGFIAPPPFLVKALLPMIPKHSVSSGLDYKINSDGGITIDYSDVGTSTKYFFANKKYFQDVVSVMVEKNVSSFLLKKAIYAFLKPFGISSPKDTMKK